MTGQSPKIDALDPLQELQDQNPAVTAAVRSLATAAVLDAEAENPTADGDEKHEIARQKLEDRLQALWKGMNAYVYDAPPWADLVAEHLVIPYVPTAIYWAYGQLDALGLFGKRKKEEGQ